MNAVNAGANTRIPAVYVVLRIADRMRKTELVRLGVIALRGKSIGEPDLRLRPVEKLLRQLEEPYRKNLQDAKFAKLSDEAQKAHLAPAAERTAGQKELVEKTLRLLQIAPDEVQRPSSAAPFAAFVLGTAKVAGQPTLLVSARPLRLSDFTLEEPST